MQIRKFQQNDRAALIELWKRAFPDDPPHNEPAKAIEAKLQVDDLIFIAEHENRLIGACMAGYDGHRGWLYALAVSPENRRAGTGTQLVRFAIQTLRELGCIKVNLQIRSSNTEVVAFYESLGFKTEDRLSMGVLLQETK